MKMSREEDKIAEWKIVPIFVLAVLLFCYIADASASSQCSFTKFIRDRYHGFSIGCILITSNDLRAVRNISELPQGSYGIPGLSYTMLAGSILHGMKKVEVLFQTYALGARTPIHRHSCEEVVVVLKESGTLYPATPTHLDHPGDPQAITVFPNSTFHIPVNDVHQPWNTNEKEDLQISIAIARPDVHLLNYLCTATGICHIQKHFHFLYHGMKKVSKGSQ